MLYTVKISPCLEGQNCVDGYTDLSSTVDISNTNTFELPELSQTTVGDYVLEITISLTDYPEVVQTVESTITIQDKCLTATIE